MPMTVYKTMATSSTEIVDKTKFLIKKEEAVMLQVLK